MSTNLKIKTEIAVRIFFSFGIKNENKLMVASISELFQCI